MQLQILVIRLYHQSIDPCVQINEMIFEFRWSCQHQYVSACRCSRFVFFPNFGNGRYCNKWKSVCERPNCPINYFSCFSILCSIIFWGCAIRYSTGLDSGSSCSNDMPFQIYSIVELLCNVHRTHTLDTPKWFITNVQYLMFGDLHNWWLWLWRRWWRRCQPQQNIPAASVSEWVKKGKKHAKKWTNRCAAAAADDADAVGCQTSDWLLRRHNDSAECVRGRG